MGARCAADAPTPPPAGAPQVEDEWPASQAQPRMVHEDAVLGGSMEEVLRSVALAAGLF